MGISNKDVSTLRELGLNFAQSKIYLTLAKTGILTAQEISRFSGIARPHVYKVLSSLEENGLVTSIINKPERFQAIVLSEGVSALLHRRIKKTAELQEKATRLTQNFKTNQSAATSEENTQFMLIPKRDAVYAKAEKMLVKAQKTIDFLCLTRRMISWLSIFQPHLEAALARKVECEVLMPMLEPSVDIWKPIKALTCYPNFTLKFMPKEPKFGFSIWDNKEVLMTTSLIDSPTPAITLWSNNKGLVDLCQEHFECMWTKAEEASIWA